MDKKKRANRFYNLFELSLSSSCLLTAASLSISSLSFSQEISSSLINALLHKSQDGRLVGLNQELTLDLKLSPHSEILRELAVQAECIHRITTTISSHDNSLKWPDKSFNIQLKNSKNLSYFNILKKHNPYQSSLNFGKTHTQAKVTCALKKDLPYLSKLCSPSIEFSAFPKLEFRELSLALFEGLSTNKSYFTHLDPFLDITLIQSKEGLSFFKTAKRSLHPCSHQSFEAIAQRPISVAVHKDPFLACAIIKQTRQPLDNVTLSYKEENNIAFLLTSTPLPSDQKFFSITDSFELAYCSQQNELPALSKGFLKKPLCLFKDISNRRLKNSPSTDDLDTAIYIALAPEYEHLSLPKTLPHETTFFSPMPAKEKNCTFYEISAFISLYPLQDSLEFNKKEASSLSNSFDFVTQLSIPDSFYKEFINESKMDKTIYLSSSIEDLNKDLFFQFFTKTADTSQIDLSSSTDTSFYDPFHYQFNYIFFPKDVLLLTKVPLSAQSSSSRLPHQIFTSPENFSIENSLTTDNNSSSSSIDISSDLVSLNPTDLPYTYLHMVQLEPMRLETHLPYFSLSEKKTPYEISLQSSDIALKINKPITFFGKNPLLTENFFEKKFSLTQATLQDNNYLVTDINPLKESSKRFLSLQKIFRPHIDKYNILFTLPSQLSSLSQLSLVNITQVKSPTLIENKIQLMPTRFASGKLNKTIRNTNENLSALPTLQDLNTYSLSEEFTTDVQVTPYKKGKGYLFAITLEPISKKLFKRAPHNFIFLVDKSGSIQKPRFDIFKAAVSKSLKYMQDGDTFNIATFDSKLSKFAADSIYYSSSSKHAAKSFIENHPRSTKYALPNIYKILIQAHEMAKKSDLPTSVFLFTNGKTLEEFNTNNDQLTYLVNANHDDFVLYTNCASHGNNETMLEIISTLNKGEFMHSQTFAAFPRKVATAVKHAGNILAQSVHISATKTPYHIEFFPDSTLTRNFYTDRPYTIIGYAEKLCDFELILQGKLGQDWLNLKKEISLKEATQDGKILHRELVTYQAYDKYLNYLKHGNTALLNEAQKLLKPYKERNF